MTSSFNKTKKYGWLITTSLLLLVVGCQKVINIDLNSASPNIVIIGNVNDKPGPYTVALNQTVNFSDPNSFPAVSGAFITISDNVGTADTLVEIRPGIYQTQKISGVPGRTYYLKVVANGQTYTASSTMPQLVPFDTLRVYSFINTFKKSDTIATPEVGFRDPPSTGNYYRFIETRNDTLLSNIFTIDDELDNGRYIYLPLSDFRGADTSLAIGDSVKVEMQCIDEGTYKYFNTFNEASGSSVNVTPANPVSTLSNNALGYFSAHTSQFRAIKVVNK